MEKSYASIRWDLESRLRNTMVQTAQLGEAFGTDIYLTLMSHSKQQRDQV